MEAEDETVVDLNAVSDDQMAAAYSGPAILANRIVLTLGPVTGRLCFIEISPSGKPEFRAAVSLTIGDLVALKTLLERQLTGAKLFTPPADENADKT